MGLSDDTLTITNSTFSGSGGVSSSASSYSGGLVGYSFSLPMITNSYWNTDAPQTRNGSTQQNPKRAQGNKSTDPSGATGLTLTQLKATSGTYPNLGATWDLGDPTQLPAVKRCVLSILNTAMTGCASPPIYGALLAGQR